MVKKMIARVFLGETHRASIGQIKISSLTHIFVRTLPLVAVKAKNQVLEVALDLQIASAGKSRLLDPSHPSLQNPLYRNSTMNFPFESWGQIILPSPTYASLVLASKAKRFKTLCSSQSLGLFKKVIFQ